MKRTIFVTITMWTILTCCKNETYDTKDISGTWYYIFNDSIYGEVIFTKTTFWENTEESGTFGGNYRIENDTFKINGISRKFSRINKDEFINIGENLTTKYYRLNIPIDTVGLLSDNEYILDKYINEWRERKYNWETNYRQKKDKKD
jgi:hypothetical protein